ncbi:hypothetical protein KFU94_34090 [Chloroflexi bacterium TSY]|nr:hypothetical protein [Chloroflexi bacterium TSY]
MTQSQSQSYDQRRLQERPNGAFMLRYWAEPRRYNEKEPIWRFCLEDVHGDQRHGFASLDALVAFLEQRTQIHHRGSSASSE